jgi:beta-glucanase (GH16 family)
VNAPPPPDPNQRSSRLKAPLIGGAVLLLLLGGLLFLPPQVTPKDATGAGDNTIPGTATVPGASGADARLPDVRATPVPVSPTPATPTPVTPVTPAPATPAAVSPENTHAPVPPVTRPTSTDQLPATSGSWTKTFEDTFDTSLDPSRWNTGFGWGPYDSSAWAASCAVPALTQVRAGTLTLGTALQAPASAECKSGHKPYSSAAVNTKGHFAQEFGYFEARIRMPGTSGTIGAWWTHLQNGHWPPEIDIAEVRGHEPGTLQMAAHAHDPQRRGNQAIGRASSHPDLSADYHTYGVDWEPSDLRFYLDGVLQASIDAQSGATFQRGESYLIFNTMVCTSAARSWCRAPDLHAAWNERTGMSVDWVRVWKHQETR